MNDINKLQKIKSEIEQAKTEKSKAEGRLEELMKRLKNDFGCTTLKQAETMLDKLDKKIKSKKEELEKGIEQLKEVYEGW